MSEPVIFRGRTLDPAPSKPGALSVYACNVSKLLRVEVWKRRNDSLWYGVVFVAGGALATAMEKTPQLVAAKLEERWEAIRMDLAEAGFV